MRRAKRSVGRAAAQLVLFVAVALGSAVALEAFVVKPFEIPSPSMVPTLAVGDRIFTNRLSGRFGTPEVGDIVVFHPPTTATHEQRGRSRDGLCAVPRLRGAVCARPTLRRSDQHYVKRIVAGPGDTIAVIGDTVIRNGRRAAEPFVAKRCPDGTIQEFRVPVRVAADHWFMMGDNRRCSEDSRFWGPVPSGWIVGGAVVRYWPFERIGGL